jgi:glutathione S-transferase
MPLPRLFDLATSMFTTVSRLGAGVQARRPARRPERPLELYEFEGCPFCRKVRDALTELDLDAMVYPCPHGGSVYREKVIAEGGKAQFPYLVDPNTGARMYESDDIVDYLFASRRPEKPLELWSFEASPFCRIAREALCELELPYHLHNVGKDGEGRDAFVARSGKMMVPYLVDPNTGRAMFESAEIRKYLYATYGA